MKETSVLYMKPKDTTKGTNVWAFPMDRLNGYHSGTENLVSGREPYIELPFGEMRVRFYHKDWNPYIYSCTANKWAMVSWDNVHLSLLGEMSGKSMYTEIAVNESPEADPFKED